MGTGLEVYNSSGEKILDMDSKLAIFKATYTFTCPSNNGDGWLSISAFRTSTDSITVDWYLPDGAEICAVPTYANNENTGFTFVPVITMQGNVLTATWDTSRITHTSYKLSARSPVSTMAIFIVR